MIIEYNKNKYVITKDTIESAKKILAREGDCFSLRCYDCIFERNLMCIDSYEKKCQIIREVLFTYEALLAEAKEDWERV